MILKRDSQVKKVYASEREIKVRTPWMRKSDAVAFGHSLFRTSPIGPLEQPEITVGPTGNQFGALASPERDQWRIKVSGAALYQMVITHEAAHLMSFRFAEERGDQSFELHGPIFAGFHLWLVRRHIGQEWAVELARAYSANGVKVLAI